MYGMYIKFHIKYRQKMENGVKGWEALFSMRNYSKILSLGILQETCSRSSVAVQNITWVKVIHLGSHYDVIFYIIQPNITNLFSVWNL
jgi:hypothetical protein